MTEMLPRALALRLLAYAQQSPEHRVCGLVGADASGPVSLRPLPNVADDTSETAAVDEADLAQQRDELEACGQRVWGGFHSCPQGIEGEADLHVAGLPEGLRLVAALDVRGVLQLRCWLVEGDNAHERELKLSGIE